eukprot:g48056.t1
MVKQSLKVGMQVQQAMRKGNGMLAFIARGFEHRNKDVMLQLYRALVRPYLDHCMQFWYPSLRKGILAFEGIQRSRHKTRQLAMLVSSDQSKDDCVAVWHYATSMTPLHLVPAAYAANNLNVIQLNSPFPRAGQEKLELGVACTISQECHQILVQELGIVRQLLGAVPNGSMHRSCVITVAAAFRAATRMDEEHMHPHAQDQHQRAAYVEFIPTMDLTSIVVLML